MVRISNSIITILNLLTFVIGFCTLALSLWLYVKIGSPCEHFLRMPLLAVGTALMAVSMAALLGSCCRISFFMWLYLITLFVVIVGLTVFTVFAIVVTNNGIGQVLSGTAAAVEGKKVGDYSRWLQDYVIDGGNWGKIKSCLVGVKLCERIEGGTNEDFYKEKLSQFQSGCCKPPNYCGLQFKNATTWTTASPDPDCKTWNNDPTQLCFDCVSCKTAVLENVKREWRMVAIINSCILVLISIIYSIGCCALRNNQSYGYTKYTNYYA